MHKYYLSDIIVGKTISALGAELRRILRILGLPSALITSVEGRVRRLSASALGAEFTLIYASASTGPAGFGLLLTALRTELAVRLASAGAFPRICRSYGLGHRLRHFPSK